MITGCGLRRCACSTAVRTQVAISPGFYGRATHLANSFERFLPAAADAGRVPVTTSIGDDVAVAVSKPEAALHSPGPGTTSAAATRPLTRAYPSAM